MKPSARQKSRLASFMTVILARPRNVIRAICLVTLVTIFAYLPESKTTFARDAAFVTPGAAATSTSASSTEGAVRVEPKSEIDTGESILTVARRTTLFFVNQSGTLLQIEKISLNSDGNVTAEITADDCSKQGSLGPTVRCSVEVAITPNSPGTWSVETLMTHSGAGRIARAKLTGKTSGTTAEKKDNGLSLSTKDIKPVDFSSIDVGQGKVVRSALMVNDSPDPITIYSIDVIEAENGLQRLDQGCAVDMELKSGESCPVTLVWTPASEGLISTDLIIRHSGRLGFAVIPIRGAAKGEMATSSSSSGRGSGSLRSSGEGKLSSLAPPLSANDVEKALSSAISNNDLGHAASLSTTIKTPESIMLRLIGTVGHRAVILKPDSTTAVVEMGNDFETGEGKATLMMVTAKSVDISYDGKRLTLPLEAAPELIANAPSVNYDIQIGEKSDKNSSRQTTKTSSSSNAYRTGPEVAGRGK
ncbi:MAG: hypothetical protein ABTQ34_03110 [Bdellovibrionales bacterium]